MTRFLPDTDILNYILKRDSNVIARFDAAIRSQGEFVLCSVVHYEISRYHRLRKMTQVAHRYRSLIDGWQTIAPGQADWDVAADLWARRHEEGRPIADADLLIAVCALNVGAVLVTNNTEHFVGLGLALENWTGA